jgi:hypothetical protein
MNSTVVQRTFFFVSKVCFFKRFDFILLCIEVKIQKICTRINKCVLGNIRSCLMIFEMNFILNEKLWTFQIYKRIPVKVVYKRFVWYCLPWLHLSVNKSRVSIILIKCTFSFFLPRSSSFFHYFLLSFCVSSSKNWFRRELFTI